MIYIILKPGRDMGKWGQPPPPPAYNANFFRGAGGAWTRPSGTGLRRQGRSQASRSRRPNVGARYIVPLRIVPLAYRAPPSRHPDQLHRDKLLPIFELQKMGRVEVSPPDMGVGLKLAQPGAGCGGRGIFPPLLYSPQPGGGCPGGNAC